MSIPTATPNEPTTNSSSSTNTGEPHGDAKDVLAALGEPYGAVSRVFWRQFLLACVLGPLMGVLSALYLTCTDWLPRKWLGSFDFGQGVFGAGEWWWVGVTAGTGLVVGVGKVVLRFDYAAGFFTELRTQHVDFVRASKVFVLSIISLAGGASLGPEWGLGCLGGSIGAWWSWYRDLPRKQRAQNTLLGLSAAMGALFPSPLLGTLMMHELANPRTFRHFMRSIVLTSTAAVSSMCVFLTLQNSTFFPELVHTIPISLYNFYTFHTWHAAVAILPAGPVGVILSPTLGGALFGLVTVWLPNTITSGSNQLFVIILHGLPSSSVSSSSAAVASTFSTAFLLLTAFGKALALGLCKGSGFFGGIIFPFFVIGTCVGCCVHRAFADSLPALLCVSCFMVAVPAAFCPIPITLVLIATSTFVFGAQQSIPIFVSVVCSHLCGAGLGYLQRALQRGAAADSIAVPAPPPPPLPRGDSRQRRTAALNSPSSDPSAKRRAGTSPPRPTPAVVPTITVSGINSSVVEPTDDTEREQPHNQHDPLREALLP
eukprot:gnl/Spiro4/118_TR65_c0_g1_i1.p1 gnl/Spiro4/118_TR65_c0_g1~~gnl/Spiro4/118_TR65_c0_g1_i1.p1  ORF type:complete len:552 (-),score=112.87 gnl/Spiro4/118_TR65_c0_g1_i1:171-1796(-)